MKEIPSEYKGTYLEKMFRLSNFASMEEMSQREYLTLCHPELALSLSKGAVILSAAKDFLSGKFF